MKTKIIPFNLETAMEIQKGKIKGKITTKEGKDVRIICTDKASTDDDNKTQIVCLIRLSAREFVSIHDPNTGKCWDIEDGNAQHLVIEVPDNEPQFKPFDRVLVRRDENDDGDPDTWVISFFMDDSIAGYRVLNGEWFDQCIPYEGNEYLAGTTEKPKEE